MFLEIQPIFTRPGYALTDTDITITNKLYRLVREVTGGKRYIAAQVGAAATQRGQQPITMFTGNKIDEAIKRRVRQMCSSGELPRDLLVAGPGVSPDISFHRIGWDITTGEQARHHVKRDVHPDPGKWDAYFVLDY